MTWFVSWRYETNNDDTEVHLFADELAALRFFDDKYKQLMREHEAKTQIIGSYTEGWFYWGSTLVLEIGKALLHD